MHPSLTLALLFASLPLIHAAPKGFKTRSFTDTHGSGLEIYPGRKRGAAVIPAQATTLPDAPIAFAPIPTHASIAEREADAASIPFNIPILAVVVSPPQPTAAAKRDANADPDTIHSLLFNPIPDFKAETGNENKRDADADAQFPAALNFPPMPAHKIDDVEARSVKRDANANAEPDTIHSLLFNPIPDFKSPESSNDAKRDADADADAPPSVPHKPRRIFVDPDVDVDVDVDETVKRDAEANAEAEGEAYEGVTAHVPIPTFALGN